MWQLPRAQNELYKELVFPVWYRGTCTSSGQTHSLSLGIIILLFVPILHVHYCMCSVQTTYFASLSILDEGSFLLLFPMFLCGHVLLSTYFWPWVRTVSKGGSRGVSSPSLSVCQTDGDSSTFPAEHHIVSTPAAQHLSCDTQGHTFASKTFPKPSLNPQTALFSFEDWKELSS